MMIFTGKWKKEDMISQEEKARREDNKEKEDIINAAQLCSQDKKKTRK